MRSTSMRWRGALGSLRPRVYGLRRDSAMPGLVLLIVVALGLVALPAAGFATAPAASALMEPPGAAAAPMTTGTSSDGRMQLTKTASPTTLPAGGGQVTYTYTVKNTRTSGNMYFESITDDKCSAVSYLSGMNYYFDWFYFQYVYYLDPGQSATWMCTQKVTQTTTNTANVVFSDAYGYT